MKTIHRKIIPLALMTAVALPFGLLTAQEADEKEETAEICETCAVGKKGKPDPAAKFAELDADKDGKITEAEIIASHQKRIEEMAKKQFASMDLDENGVVTETELKIVSRRGAFGPQDRGGMRRPGPDFHGRRGGPEHGMRQGGRDHDGPRHGFHGKRPSHGEFGKSRGGDFNRGPRGDFARRGDHRGGPRPMGRPGDCNCAPKGPEKKAKPAAPKVEKKEEAPKAEEEKPANEEGAV